MEDLYDTIEQYVLGKMPEGERAGFEARMNADPALKEEVAAFRVARQVLKKLPTACALTLPDGSWPRRTLRRRAGRSCACIHGYGQ
ncbi:MAG: hypothetical protein KDD12_12625 [Lewinella sp.]|nr:hypothetical protein [Lewinella sp.]